MAQRLVLYELAVLIISILCWLNTLRCLSKIMYTKPRAGESVTMHQP